VLPLKRQPLLADLFLASKKIAGIPNQFWDTTRENLMMAKRFVLDEDAARYCAEMVRRAPRIIADAQDFALRPFEQMWIEFPFRVYWEEMHKKAADATSDERLGYLFIGPIVRVITEAHQPVPVPGGFSSKTMVSPLQYHLNQPWSFETQIKMAEKYGTSRLGFDALYWGSAYNQFVREQDMAGLHSLRENHSFSIEWTGETLINTFHELSNGSAGDLKNIIALLLFLNRTSKTQTIRELPPERRMIHAKPSVLLRHSVITLKVNPVPKLLKLAAGEGVFRRLHDVRGHFCHNEQARTAECEHEWREIDGHHLLQWRCTSCQGMRWWRKQHRRGHEELGRVTSTYQVTE
jgi:hypothetical protein